MYIHLIKFPIPCGSVSLLKWDSRVLILSKEVHFFEREINLSLIPLKYKNFFEILDRMLLN